MDVDDHGPAAGEVCRGFVEEARDRAPVETGPVHQLRFGEVAGVEARGLALRPARERPARNLERVRIRRRARRGERKAQLGAVRPPAEAGDHAGRQLGDAALDAGRGADDVQHPDPTLVRDKRNRAPVGREVELLHVPGDLARQEAIPLGGQLQIRKPLEFRAAVGGEVDALAVASEPLGAIGDALVSLLGCEQRLLPAGHVHEPQTGLVDRDALPQEDLAVVR